MSISVLSLGPIFRGYCNNRRLINSLHNQDLRDAKGRLNGETMPALPGLPFDFPHFTQFLDSLFSLHALFTRNSLYLLYLAYLAHSHTPYPCLIPFLSVDLVLSPWPPCLLTFQWPQLQFPFLSVNLTPALLLSSSPYPSFFSF